MAYDKEQNESGLPTDNNENPKAIDFLPKYFRTDVNKKLLSSTIQQMINPGAVEKINAFAGRRNSKVNQVSDVYLPDVTADRENYQFEPSIVYKDQLDNVLFYKNYPDFIGQVKNFKGPTENHNSLNSQEMYSWNPHIDWDKFANFREYYWLPLGPLPIPVFGEQKEIESTIVVSTVVDDDNTAFLFSSRGTTRNPTLRLFKGQTYVFEVNTPGHPFTIGITRDFIDTDLGFSIEQEISSEIYDKDMLKYVYNEEGRLVLTEDDYIEQGVIKWTIPDDVPDSLYYLSQTDINTSGIILSFAIEENTEIDLAENVIGKKTYKTGTGVNLSNGMKVYFQGTVTPSEYSEGFYYIEGVGTSIKLISENDLEVPSIFTSDVEIAWDEYGFDAVPYEDAASFPGTKDYITINRSSHDRNPWSRYNRWFHKDVIEKSYEVNNTEINLDQNFRAKRPIIEFNAGMKLFNHGTFAKKNVNLVDNFTKDVFSNVEGSLGYNVDGVDLTDGMRVLFTADPDSMVNGKIYEVNFITHNSRRQISLVETTDTMPLENETVLALSGESLGGKMFWYNGTQWIQSQEKTGVNQAPLFDVFDHDGIILNDQITYPASDFIGNKIFSYKVGTGSNDTELGFPLKYRNIANIGDIVFSFDIQNQIVRYQNELRETLTTQTDTGFLKKFSNIDTFEYVNGWTKTNILSRQAVIQQQLTVDDEVNNFPITVFNKSGTLSDLVVKAYVDGKKVLDSKFTIDNINNIATVVFTEDLEVGKTLVFRCFSNAPKNENGYYEIPVNLEKNPLNDNLVDFTLGEVNDHVESIIEEVQGFDGIYPGVSNLRDLGNVTHYGKRFVQHSGPFNLAAFHITDKEANIVKAINFVRSEYGKTKRRLIALANESGIEGTAKDQLDTVLERFSKETVSYRNFYYGDMVGKKANTSTIHNIDNSEETYFAIGLTNFDINKLSNQAVYVYLNGVQLLKDRDYTISDNFVNVTATLAKGDVIRVDEFENTNGCYIPPTPTKLGLFPLYYPEVQKDHTVRPAVKTFVTTKSQTRFVLENVNKIIEATDLIVQVGDVKAYGNIDYTIEKVRNGLFYVDFVDPVVANENVIIGFPQCVIQGHDGSLTKAWNDFRDDFLLEYEYRVYNNIKLKYDASVLDINNFVPTFDRDTKFTKEQIDNSVLADFTSWLEDAGNLTYTENNFYDERDGFTYNYSFMSNTENEPLKGFWRSVYKTYYGTDRPNTHPWEMLGLTIKPTWWDEQYGPAPYTSDNILLWTDMAEGIIRTPGVVAQKNKMYKHSKLLDAIPVDSNGKLVDPYKAGLAQNYKFDTASNNFVFGDEAPVETAWRRSSEYPFALLKAWMLNQPAQIFGLAFDRSRIKKNLSDQYVYTETNKAIRCEDLVFPSITGNEDILLTSGLVNFIASYMSSKYSSNYNNYQQRLKGLKNQLSIRVGGFASKEKLKLVLDARSPLNKSSNFVPEENYQIFLNTSSPLETLVFSGMIIEKTADNTYILKGYDGDNPTFPFYKPLETNSDTSITVGGISANYVVWTEDQEYTIGTIVEYQNNWYRTTSTHKSSETFDATKFAKLPTLPITGGISAKIRKRYETTVSYISYGTILESVQEVVDFMQGYEKFLKQQGFELDYYNRDTDSLEDMTLCIQEFMFWVTQNWEAGTILTTSPCANRCIFTKPYFVVDDIFDDFYGYNLLSGNGEKLGRELSNIYRDDTNTFGITPSNTNEGIYLIKLPLVQTEHVILLDNSTVFNDVIYDVTPGYRQERIKLVGYRTDNWSGGLNIPGFFYDNVKVDFWKTYEDYAVGDVVKFKEFFYSANVKHNSGEVFVSANWNRLSEEPKAELYPNFDYRVNQFTDFYDLDTDNFDTEQQRLGQHLIGYQKREYLSNIIPDSVSQYKFYQGFIQEKGTKNSLTKLFDALSTSGEESLKFFEEWAIRVGSYGALDNKRDLEFKLDESNYKLEPQLFELTNNKTDDADLIYKIADYEVYEKPEDYANTPFVTSTAKLNTSRNNGWVRLQDVKGAVTTYKGLLDLNIATTYIGDNIWIQNKKNEWDVVTQVKETNKIVGYDIEVDGTYTDSRGNILNVLKIVFDNYVDFTKGEIIGIYGGLSTITGYWEILEVGIDYVIVDTGNLSVTETQINTFPDSTENAVSRFVTRRFTDIEELNQEVKNLFHVKNDKVWIEKVDGNWGLYENEGIFTLQKEVYNPSGDQDGFATAYDVNSNNTYIPIASLGHPGEEGILRLFYRPNEQLEISLRQIMEPELVSDPEIGFGRTVAISDDATYIAVGAPYTSNVKTLYIDELQPDVIYYEGDIVRDRGVLWQANKDIGLYYDSVGDSSTITINDADWDEVNLITGLEPSLDILKNRLVPSVEFTDQMLNVALSTATTPTEFETWARSIADDGFAFGNLDKSTTPPTIRSADVLQFIKIRAGTAAQDNVDRWKNIILPSLLEQSWYNDTFTLGHSGSGIEKQGTVYLYKQNADTGLYEVEHIICSPFPKANEQFGTKVQLRKAANGSLKMFVGAPGADGTDVGRIYMLDNEGGEWKYSSDRNYKGVYNDLFKYNENDLTFYNGALYKAATNIAPGTSLPSDAPNLWIEQTDVNTEYTGYVPRQNFITSENESDVTNQSINIGKVFDTNKLGDVLAFSAKSGNDELVSIYTNVFARWRLNQTIVNQEGIDYSLAVNDTGDTIGIGAPLYNTEENTDAGSVKLYSQNSTGDAWELTQTLTSPYKEKNEAWGLAIDFSADKLLVVGKNTDTRTTTTFDRYVEYKKYAIGKNELKNTIYSRYVNDNTGVQNTEKTTFDGGRTTFVTKEIDSGRLGIYEKLGNKFIFGEDLPYSRKTIGNDLSNIKLQDNNVYVGLPMINPSEFTDSSRLENEDSTAGMFVNFRADKNKNSWKVVTSETGQVDLNKIGRVFLYSQETNDIITNLDVIDPRQGKIAGVADQEITYKTPYDPAIYSNGSGKVVVDQAANWCDEHVGEIWWNIDTVSWFNPYQGPIQYRSANWHKQTQTSLVSILEWVESTVPPQEYISLADTTQGYAQGISGTPYYDANTYSVKSKVDSVSGQAKLYYYFWVQNKQTIPNIPNRALSVFEIAKLIEDPSRYGYRYIQLLDDNKFSLHNVRSFINDKDTILHFTLIDDAEQKTPIHNEYQLMSSGLATSKPNEEIESKWIDSLVGYDLNNATVPDPNLSPKVKYGILNYPRQGMFINRIEALKQVVERVNTVFAKTQIVDNYDISLLQQNDPVPNVSENLYDTIVETTDLLRFVGVAKVQTAEFTPVIENSKIVAVTITNSGRGYVYPPTVRIEDTYGRGAVINTTINNLGQVTGATVRKQGKNYSSATKITARPFSVLVNSDSDIGGRWAIYTYDSTSSEWDRLRSQSYVTTGYWNYADWYATGYNAQTPIDQTVDLAYQLFRLENEIGDIVKIKEVGSGGWLLLKKIDDQLVEDYTINYETIGRQNGTIKLSNKLYNFLEAAGGFDTEIYDTTFYDREPIQELRNILSALKNDIYVNDLEVEWNNLFFASLKYAMSEQTNLDWAFKSSFIRVKHVLGDFEQKLSYQNDNLENYEDYVKEVKPYHSKIREYISSYDHVEPTNSLTTDFDVPPSYSAAKEIETIAAKYDNGIITDIIEKYQQYPYKSWVDNNGYDIIEIEVTNGGSNYKETPPVTILGDSGATAKAYLSKGSVSKIEIVKAGSKVYEAPLVVIDEPSPGGIQAKATAIIGNPLVRSTHMIMKFDRTTGTYLMTNIDESETFTGTGSTTKFSLKWPINRNTNTYEVTVNGLPILKGEYSVDNEKDTAKGYDRQLGYITFEEAPATGATIVITYKRNLNMLTAADRIYHAYNPATGMPGKNLSQLMDGVDYDGAVYDGISFGTEQGFDIGGFAEYRFDTIANTTDDEIFVLDGSTTTFTLSTPLEDGVQYNVYWKSVNAKLNDSPIRLDDPDYDGITVLDNKYALMLPLSGDGVTDTVNIDWTRWKTVEDRDFLVAGDTVIIRKSTSDGSFELAGSTYDVDLSGGDIDYGDALGVSPSDIVVDGDGFVTPTTSKGPEELVPGQLLDTLDISVYHRTTDGTGMIGSINYIIDDSTSVYVLPSVPHSNDAIIVKLDNETIDNDRYEVDWDTQTLTFTDSTVPYGTHLNITTIGTNGAEMLDTDYVKFDGSTYSYITAAKWSDALTAFVTINGVVQQQGVNFTVERSTSSDVFENRVKLTFEDGTMQPDDYIQWSVYASNLKTYSQVLIDNTFEPDGQNDYYQFTTTEFPIPFNRRPLGHQILVFQNKRLLQPGYSIKHIATNSLTYELESWQFTDPTLIESENILVFVNDRQLTKNEFTYDTVNARVFLSRRDIFEEGDTIGIYVIQYADYYFVDTKLTCVLDDSTAPALDTYLEVGNELVIESIGDSTTYTSTIVAVEDNTVTIRSKRDDIFASWVAGNDFVISVNDGDSTPLQMSDIEYVASDSMTFAVAPSSGANIEVYQFSNHDINNFERQQYDVLATTTVSAGTDAYYKRNLLSQGFVNLRSNIQNVQYVWVAKNGELLSPNADYTLNAKYNAVSLNLPVLDGDRIDVLEFGNDPATPRFGFRIFRDILGRTHYKRLNEENVFSLKDPLNYYDTRIVLEGGADNLYRPSKGSGLPGVVWIDGERIEYYDIKGSTLLQLRRGTLGTGVINYCAAGTRVLGQGPNETIEYSDTTYEQEIIADGSSSATEYTLDFTPSSANEIDVFLGGKRLRKTSMQMFNWQTNQDSTEADYTLDAEYRVSGSNIYIEPRNPLTNDIIPPSDFEGQKIKIVRKTGKIWNDTGKSLANSDNKIAKFIRAATIRLPK